MNYWMIGALGVASAFAGNETIVATKKAPKTEELTIVNKDYVDPESKSKLGYVEVITGSIAHKDADGMAIGLRLGKTYFFEKSGIDISISGMGNDNQAYWTFPKLMWLYYQPASKEASNAFGNRSDFILGFGASFGGATYKPAHGKRAGLEAGGLAEFTAGYRVNFAKDMKGMLKINVSAPFAPHFSAPVLSASFGVAY